MNGYFVTGTDTGVGKTHVTAALAKRARQLGKRVFAWKPIETGCGLVNGQLVGEDQEAISSEWQEGELRGLYRFRRPVAPLMAARTEGEIDPERIVETFRLGANADLLLVEGAGGWRVPITDDLDMGGLARRLGLPVIVVARGTLGTINHTLLTVEAVGRDGQQIAAVVMSCRPGEDPAFVKENADEIRRRFSGLVLCLWTDPGVLDGLLQVRFT
ncbi:MAG TPA: dethiobiotin synthase [Solirubrobacterales bacterium]|nr:dethiobiotin synthase [Solirubrobacterales bacterium]